MQQVCNQSCTPPAITLCLLPAQSTPKHCLLLICLGRDKTMTCCARDEPCVTAPPTSVSSMMENSAPYVFNASLRDSRHAELQAVHAFQQDGVNTC